MNTELAVVLALLVLLMLAVGILGSIMSSTGVIAIFIPVALRIAQSTGTPASRLMMPMSVAALISGMMTLVGTAPNLVVNSELVRGGADGFHFFSFTPFGVPILALGLFTCSSRAAGSPPGPTVEPRSLPGPACVVGFNSTNSPAGSIGSA
jgi:di/tricarboxylate transporter